MPMLPTDDREQSIRPLTPRSLRAVAQGNDPARAAMARYLRQAVSAEAQRWTLGRFAGGVAAAIAILAVLIFLAYFKVLRGPQMLLGFLVLGALTHAVFRALAGRKIAGELAATAVAHGLCGQCGYTLGDLDAHADGCLVCPECGAAWRSIRIIAPHWLNFDPRRARRPPEARWWVRFAYLVPRSGLRLGPDDRGRIVPILDSRLRALTPKDRAQVPTDERRRLVRRLRWNGRIGRAALGLFPMALGGFALWAAVREALDRSGELGLAVFFGGLGAICILVGVLMNLGHSFYSPRRAARVLAEHGRCACCAADLREVPLGADGLVQCPRCASAWRTNIAAADFTRAGGGAPSTPPTARAALSPPAPAP